MAGGTPIPDVARLSLTIDGYEIAQFSDLVSLDQEVEPAEYHEADDGAIQVVHVPGRVKRPTVVLRRPLTTSLELWAWYEAVLSGDHFAAAQKSATLTLYNTEGKPVARYYLEKAWPSRLALDPAQSPAAPTRLFETLTLVCEALQRVVP
jgi:phage tail-like protein